MTGWTDGTTVFAFIVGMLAVFAVTPRVLRWMHRRD